MAARDSLELVNHRDQDKRRKRFLEQLQIYHVGLG